MVTITPNQKSGQSDLYEWKSAALTIAGVDADSDITGETGFTTLFDTVKTARKIVIEVTATTYVRLNADDNDIITVGATTPFEADMTVTSMFVSTGGSASTITVKLFA